ncbi:MAG: hypothetical protein J7604_21070 [Sporocytophaga sp.]|uniref:hypothetical protein n=1 Tax=Sporocytophaga sp. TaxID=2231183 RepID=UPI001B13E12D|nr:hypothetical protein [Sporocytophaga sp.]MBO9702717.1 hypothetical protein [Sporocytophaga sp.]
MKKVFHVLSLALMMSTFCNGQAKETTKNQTQKQNSNMTKQIFIDKFFIPESSVEQFIKKTSYNRSFIKNLPGFIKDEMYTQRDENGNLILITIATWENQNYLISAKSAVQEEYKRKNFNPAEFMQQLGVKMERGVFTEYQD